MKDLDGLTPQQRREFGASLRRQVPRSSHADWTPDPTRPDSLALLARQDESRLPWLVPYRHERMAESPFAFFRGSAKIMAADLACTPSGGLRPQICGDAHLANFGLFGSPERNLVFDMNDFDETLPGPWEWDLKRLAVSFAVASRHRGFKPRVAHGVVESALRSYRDGMAQFAEMPAIAVWYHNVRAEDISTFLADDLKLTKAQRKAMASRHSKAAAKAQSRDSYHALSRLAQPVDGSYRFISAPPFTVPIIELLGEYHPDEIRAVIADAFTQYRASLPDARRVLLDHYRLVDVALRVVGVGSVGTRCFIALFEGKCVGDPLILQLKEANHSALEEYLEPSPYQHQGQRIVEGQRLMQAVSDSFLGWSSAQREGHSTDYYWRQLRDMKLSIPIEEYEPHQMDGYARLCGMTLARAHARTGDAAAIAGYIGTGKAFIQAVLAFANAYADQNEHDYRAFIEALHAGKVMADGELRLAAGSH